MSGSMVRCLISEDGTSDEEQHKLSFLMTKSVNSSWNSKLIELFNSEKYQIGVIVLAFIDLLFIIGEILFDLNGSRHVYASILHWLSLSIIIIFCCESILKVIAYKMEFFKRKGDLVDMGIVFVALGLELYFSHSHNAYAGSGLIIIARFWRLVRIHHSYEVAVHTKERQRKTTKDELTKVKTELDEISRKCSKLQEDFKKLLLILTKHNIEIPIWVPEDLILPK